jgi:hypothetical protein
MKTVDMLVNYKKQERKIIQNFLFIPRMKKKERQKTPHCEKIMAINFLSAKHHQVSFGSAIKTADANAQSVLYLYRVSSSHQ